VPLIRGNIHFFPGNLKNKNRSYSSEMFSFRSTVFLFSLFISCNALTQDYQQVEKVVAGYPGSFSSPGKLAERINHDFSTPEEKARAIFAWISHHIAYDVKAFAKGGKVVSFTYSSAEEKISKEKALQEDLARRTLRRKKGICYGYSTLYKIICDYTDIECVIISGTAKILESDIGRIPGTPNHTWNAVKINGKWKLVDATWGAGSIYGKSQRFVAEYDDIYFFTPPEIFFLNHYPADKQWLFVKMTAKAFASLPLYYPAALRSEIKLIKPAEGMVHVSKKKPVQVIMKNFHGGTVNFALNGRNYPDPVKPQRRRDETVFYLNIRRPGILTLFVDGKAFIGFKLVYR